jgi:hypothetical protein
MRRTKSAISRLYIITDNHSPLDYQLVLGMSLLWSLALTGTTSRLQPVVEAIATKRYLWFTMGWSSMYPGSLTLESVPINDPFGLELVSGLVKFTCSSCTLETTPFLLDFVLVWAYRVTLQVVALALRRAS